MNSKACILIPLISLAYAVSSIIIFMYALGIAHGSPIIGGILFSLLLPSRIIDSFLDTSELNVYGVFVVQFIACFFICILIKISLAKKNSL